MEVPFDPMLVFSTNLEPRSLVDDAFLRRIPYKIEVRDPTEDEFRKVFFDLAQPKQNRFTSMQLCDPRNLFHGVRGNGRQSFGADPKCGRRAEEFAKYGL